MFRTATQKGRVLVGVGSVAAAAAAAIALRADLLVSYGFGKALEAQKPVLPFEMAESRRHAGEVGDEDYWLTRTKLRSMAASDRQLDVGDRITITGHDGRPRHLEVVAVKVAAAPLLKIAAGARSVPLLLVTCRVVDPAQPKRQDLVQFMIEDEEPELSGSHESMGRT